MQLHRARGGMASLYITGFVLFYNVDYARFTDANEEFTMLMVRADKRDQRPYNCYVDPKRAFNGTNCIRVSLFVNIHKFDIRKTDLRI